MKKETNTENNLDNKQSDRLFNKMPEEFQKMVQEYAVNGSDPSRFLEYVDNHVEDYKSTGTIAQSLLMVQEAFGSTVAAPANLASYSNKTFYTYFQLISSILNKTEAILFNLEKEGTIPGPRKEDCIGDDTIESLTQNAHLYLYLFYERTEHKEKAEFYLEKVISDTAQNVKWILSHSESEADYFWKEDRNRRHLDMDFYTRMFPFYEPLEALVQEKTYSEDTLYAYKKFLKRLRQMSGVRAHYRHIAAIEDARKQLCELYEYKLEDVEDEIECSIEELVRLYKEKKKLKKMLKKERDPLSIPNDSLPF